MRSYGRVSGWNLPGKERRKLGLLRGNLGCSLDSGIVLLSGRVGGGCEKRS